MRKAAGHTDELKRRSMDHSELIAGVRLAESHELSQVLSVIFSLLERTQNAAQRTSDTHEQRYLTPEEAAAYINVSPSWLNRAKARNEGPVWISLGDISGSPVRYDVEDLDIWMHSRRSKSPSGPVSAISNISGNDKRLPVRKIEGYKRVRAHESGHR